ncbi:MAG TPA: hypothetical protein DCG12_06005 [Planctomycetaceae bacterium]|nr:hypothetical protein [Planctomycetaceae bacterium]
MSEDKSGAKLALHIRILIAMLGGTVAGVLVNTGDVAVDGEINARVVESTVGFQLSEQIAGATSPEDQIYSASFGDRDAFVASFPDLAEVDATDTIEVSNARARITHGISSVSITWQREHNGNPAVTTISAASVDKLPPFWKNFVQKNPPGVRDHVTTAAKCLGDLFLRLLKMVTVPLIFTSLITGVTGLGAHGRFGSMFGRTIVYYMATSLLAITVGLILVNIIQPGAGAILPGGGKALESPDQGLIEVIYNQILRLIPTNPFSAMAGGEFLSIISFAIFVGMFINVVGGDHGRRMKEFFESAFAVMMKMTGWVISLAPIGVAAFMIYATSTQGLGVFQTLAKYMLTVFLALVIHATVILAIVVGVVGRRNPLEYARQMSPALLTAFSTASSNATLPLTMSCVEKRAGISNETSSFVLPLGATINMDGTALYEVVAVLFIAQATPGFDLTVAQQITIAFTALIASVGAAGIPHAGLVMMAIVLQAVGLPLEAQGIIIAVDRILDMCRTSVNVWSDSCGCAVVGTAADGTSVADSPEDPATEDSAPGD